MNDAGKRVAESECSSTCAGDAMAKNQCGGGWRISLWSTLSGQALSSALSQSPSIPSTSTKAATTTKALATTTSTASPETTTPASPTSTSYTPTSPVPASSNPKYVWAHQIIGNTYPYTYNTWVSDITLAKQSGIDGFVLNLGRDSWQPARVADAYRAAEEQGFKMMLSFDMYEISCGGTEKCVVQTHMPGLACLNAVDWPRLQAQFTDNLQW
jgi:glucan endo-1,3-alpha-glucosidase